MADNPTVNGLQIAADEVGSVFHQLVIVEYGPADSPVRVTTSAPLPTIDAAGNTALTSILTKLSNDPATQTTLATVASRLIGATPHYDAAGTGDVDLFTGVGRLMSFSARETTGSATATFYLRDGVSGTIIVIVTLAPGESIRDTFAPNGIALATGLRLDRLTGSTEVTAAVA